ncbi:uncharacterized protein LOC143864247 isoform X2 [Tasmannia lanceolata]|uniref:uncharacterized protein LOC143864247 isoform X2 n=1 Tax=Tasmannia lanceolata TaxID=3420 RepID=UPI004063AF29
MALALPLPSQENTGRAKWTLARDEFIVNEMLSLKREKRWTGEGPRKDCWEPLLEVLNKKFPLHTPNIRQLKSRIQELKRRYRIVKQLRDSGFGWDDDMHLVVSEEAAWEQYIQEHPEAKMFKRVPLPLYDELNQLYEGSECKQLVLNPNSEDCLLGLESTQTRLSHQKIEEENEGYVSSNDQENNVDGSNDQGNHSHRSKRRFVTPSTTVCEKKSVSNRLEEFSKLVALTSVATSLSKLDPYSYETCLDELQDLEGLDEGELIRAVDVLQEQQNRIAFVKLRGVGGMKTMVI